MMIACAAGDDILPPNKTLRALTTISRYQRQPKVWGVSSTTVNLGDFKTVLQQVPGPTSRTGESVRDLLRCKIRLVGFKAVSATTRSDCLDK